MKSIKLLGIIALMACVVACANKPAQDPNFVKMENGHFVKDGKPYYYVGTNFWYGAILASEGQGGDRERLGRELDKMKEMGKVTNLSQGVRLVTLSCLICPK